MLGLILSFSVQEPFPVCVQGEQAEDVGVAGGEQVGAGRLTLMIRTYVHRSMTNSWHWLAEREEFQPSDITKNESDRFPRSSSFSNSTANSDLNLGPKVSWPAWGAYEPGKVGACAVLDSSLRWSWNAIGRQAHILTVY